MEYVDFLNADAKLVHNQVLKAGYEIRENSPYCLMMKNTLALHDGKAKVIYLCTQNLKNILLWDAPVGPRSALSNSREKKASFFSTESVVDPWVHDTFFSKKNCLC